MQTDPNLAPCQFRLSLSRFA